MSTPAIAPRLPRQPRLGRTEALAALAAAAVAALAAVSIGPKALALPAVVVIVLFFVREPLALLALFLDVGLFKEEAFVKSLPIDATLALGLLVAMVCGLRLVSGRVRPVSWGYGLMVAVLILSVAISLTWTSAPDYGSTKATTFLTVTMLAIGAPFFLVERWEDLRRFLMWTVVVAVPVAILALTHPAEETGRLAGDNTIGTSRLLSTGALILLLGALGSRSRWKLPAIALAAGFVATAAAVGSRGPILSLVLALGFTVVAWLLRSPGKLAPIIAIGAVGVAVVPFVSLPATSSERLSQAATDPVAAFREDDRYVLYQQAFQLIDDNPIRGAGVGSFITVSPEAKWPHNMFVELWAELGLAAMLVVAGMVITVIAGLFRLAWQLASGSREQELVYILLGVFFFNLLAVQVSGNINDNRDFWGVLAIASIVVAGSLKTDEPQAPVPLSSRGQ